MNQQTNKQISANFADIHPPLSSTQAAVEADRCYFCFDAPCTEACPTGIDVPMFIQKIHSNNLVGSARTILSENIMGGMCARVCPTETLCEQACVRNDQDATPVKIGLLQRFATDAVLNNQRQLFERGATTGKRVAIVGAGPAGLSCAHRLSIFGHDVSIFEARDKIAGLNEYGIAAYKATNDIAAKEAQYILAIGGIEVKTNMALGENISLAELREQYDAVFLSVGLGATRQLNINGEDSEGVIDAVDYIAHLRQADDKGKLSVAKRVVVIGGGMTAIDIAVQSKLLGAEEVTIAYRRGKAQMGASVYEQELAQTHGIQIKHWLSPHQILTQNDCVTGIEFEIMTPQDDGDLMADCLIADGLIADGSVSGGLVASGEMLTLQADVVFKAIGQLLEGGPLAENSENNDSTVFIEAGRVVVDDDRQTSLPDVWAGGDCIPDGENLTVTAVQDGKTAAISINETLKSKHPNIQQEAE